MKKEELVDQLGAEETGETYTYKVRAIVSSRSAGTRVWEKDFYVFLPARVALQSGSEKVRDQKLKEQLVKWIQEFQQRKPGRQIRVQVTDEEGKQRLDLELNLGETN